MNTQYSICILIHSQNNHIQWWNAVSLCLERLVFIISKFRWNKRDSFEHVEAWICSCHLGTNQIWMSICRFTILSYIVLWIFGFCLYYDFERAKCVATNSRFHLCTSLSSCHSFLFNLYHCFSLFLFFYFFLHFSFSLLSFYFSYFPSFFLVIRTDSLCLLIWRLKLCVYRLFRYLVFFCFLLLPFHLNLLLLVNPSLFFSPVRFDFVTL